jgi:acetyl-CoA carboxylase biotin carboxylase subunit
MGDKNTAKDTAKRAGVPVVPGSEGIIESLEEAQEIAAAIGYPVLIKATAGGGGRGMRPVHQPGELEQAYESARAEARTAFGNPDVYMERLVQGSRHVEIQLLADQAGNVVHLGERECSIQRRHQKLLEETPSPALSPALREQMGQAAIALARHCGYVSVGTVEFLLDRQKRFYFMELNARVQVEHPITEMVTGVDIVQEQIRIAAGLPLSFTQNDVESVGHAIECRINAEDAARGFAPCSGRITRMYFPSGPGVRFDTHVYGGYEISPYYDSLLGKLIVYAEDRQEAIKRMGLALDECVIRGITTTVPFQRDILADPRFVSGDYDTSFIETMAP